MDQRPDGRVRADLLTLSLTSVSGRQVRNRQITLHHGREGPQSLIAFEGKQLMTLEASETSK